MKSARERGPRKKNTGLVATLCPTPARDLGEQQEDIWTKPGRLADEPRRAATVRNRPCTNAPNPERSEPLRLICQVTHTRACVFLRRIRACQKKKGKKKGGGILPQRTVPCTHLAHLVNGVRSDVEGHLRRIGGRRRMNASYSLVHVVPGSDQSRQRGGAPRQVATSAAPASRLAGGERLSLPGSLQATSASRCAVFPPRRHHR